MTARAGCMWTHAGGTEGRTLPSKLAVAKTPGFVGDHAAAKFQLPDGGSSASSTPADTSQTIVLHVPVPAGVKVLQSLHKCHAVMA